MNKTIWFKTLDLSLRLFAGLSILIYGMAKPWQFEEFEFATNLLPVNELSGMGLMWNFFGYSLTVPLVVGCFECVGGILLMIDKTKLIGASLLLPVISNIVLFDFVYEVAWGATLNGVLYLAILLLTFFFEKSRVKRAIQMLIVQQEDTQPGPRWWIHSLLILGSLFLVYVFAQFYGYWVSIAASFFVTSCLAYYLVNAKQVVDS